MKERKFRAMDMIGQWVFGDLIHKRHDPDAVMIRDSAGLESDILPETIGQYIWAKDKHGKDVYEGDVIEVITHFDYIISAELANGLVDTGKAYYVATFDVNASRMCFCLLSWTKDKPRCSHLAMHFAHGYEIVGNIHENNN